MGYFGQQPFGGSFSAPVIPGERTLDLVVSLYGVAASGSSTLLRTAIVPAFASSASFPAFASAVTIPTLARSAVIPAFSSVAIISSRRTTVTDTWLSSPDG